MAKIKNASSKTATQDAALIDYCATFPQSTNQITVSHLPSARCKYFSITYCFCVSMIIWLTEIEICYLISTGTGEGVFTERFDVKKNKIMDQQY